MLSDRRRHNSDFIPLISDDSEISDLSDIPEELPILPLRNMVLFPGVVLPISVGRDKSVKLIREAYDKEKIVGITSQKDENIDDPKSEDLNTTGTVAQILKILQMPDNSTSVIIQGKKRFKIKQVTQEEPYFKAKYSLLEEKIPKRKNDEFDALVASIKDMSIRIIQLSTNMPPEAAFAVKNIESATFLINFVCSNTDINFEVKQNLLEINDMKKRALEVLKHLTVEVQKLELKDNIESKVKNELDQQQKEYILNQQLKTIRNELGKDPVTQEIEELKKKAAKQKWGKEAAEVFKRELERFERINPASPDYSNQLDYLQILLELPWNVFTKDNFDLNRASLQLDKDHYGLDKVKDRILEHLAVLKLKGDLKSPIICLYGPPGVGKTSLGKSIAKALKRKYVRMSLGGLHDEAEIRGHRKTYIGAMPGRIIQNLRKTKSSNPVFVLDEIDKIGNDFRGDPAFALLEVLDPEQNKSFYDNYLELEFDLSKVMFIATANTLNPIKPALLDRMEIINMTGYVVEEKVEIAKRHLIPKQLEAHGVRKNQLRFSDEVIEKIIENYTKESGVRQLDKKIAEVVRKIAKKIGFEQSYNTKLKVDDIADLLGSRIYFREKYQDNNFAGIVTGLAWTAAGGDIIFIEASISKGTGKLTLTGNLGDVMKESAILALEYLKANSYKFDLGDFEFDAWNVHIHVPEGAIPKDGPSAGITIVTALVSVFSQRKVREHIAMTGEITLRGKLLPVGGIKEKILAAKRANIKEILLSKENRKDVEEINELYLQGLTFHYFDTISEVLNIALLYEKVDNPVQLKYERKNKSIQ